LVGTLAPDFEYFLRLVPDSGFGHTLWGAFVLTLPLALVVLWLFHAYVKMPLARLAPDPIQRQLTNHLGEFHFGGAARFSLIVSSVLLGIATHLAWDSLTHPNTWPYHHWAILSQTVVLPIVGRVPYYKVFQHVSTGIGVGVLSTWLVLWYRSSEPSSQALGGSVSPRHKIVMGAVFATAACTGATLRAIAGTGFPSRHAAQKQFAAQLLVTAIALVWWQLVAYGIFSPHRVPSK
jgi:hypothetical protein